MLATGGIEFNVIMFLKVCAYVDLYVCVCACVINKEISRRNECKHASLFWDQSLVYLCSQMYNIYI